MSSKKRGLGRNLGELLSLSMDTAVADNAAATPTNQENSLHFLPIEQLQRGQFQPRRDMDPTALAELAQSIKTQGILQPLVVRLLDKEAQRFEIIAGERRWQAAKQAGLTEVPVLIKDVGDEDTMALALIENMQRENLNAVEEAIAIARLVNECELTQQQVADLLGKPRSTISNLLRVLTLTSETQALLACGDIDFGHAKVLLALPENQQSTAARTIVAKQLSVRETEKLVRNLQQSPQKKLPQTTQQITPDIALFQDRLSQLMGTKAAVKYQNGRGKIESKFTNDDDFNRILDALGLLEG